VKRGLFVPLVVVLAAPAVSSAQEQPVPQQPLPQPSAAPVESRRQSVRIMEAVLSRAVLSGAEHLAEQLGSGNPNMSFFTGQARARGFVLEGYGVFFHVEIPEMQQSVVWSVTTMERDASLANSLAALRRVVETVPDGGPRMQAEEALKRLQLQFGPPPVVDPVARGGERRMMSAANVAVGADLDPVPLPILRDPNAAYREAIKSALIDAMLEHSRGINIQPDEWLTVAAHRGDSPLAPNEIVTTSTLVLRIKGSDLAVYDADRTKKDEIRKRVETREF
jgi:hypothetical protein